MKEVVDLRSDAITRPTEAMWEAMRADPLDWSRLGDRTVRLLEDRGAELLDTEAAVFAPTGTMANTMALLAVTRPGDRFLTDRRAHVVISEDRSFARLAGLYPELLPGERGHPSPEQVATALDSRHLDTATRTPLVWLENSHTAAGGTVAKPEVVLAVAAVASDRGAAVHIDGARLFNAADALGVSPAGLIPKGASITVNLNKGLGAPAGALLCGPRTMISEARARLLGLGGVLANAGLVAAAGLIALKQESLVQLAADNARARELADALSKLADLRVSTPETNIVFVDLPTNVGVKLAKSILAGEGVLALSYGESTIRLVTNRHVETKHLDQIVEAFDKLLQHRAGEGWGKHER